LDGGGKSLPTTAAVSLGFEPFGLPRSRLHQARFHVVAVERAMTPWTVAELRRPPRIVGRLTFQGRLQHLLRENGADAEANVFPFGQGNAPRQPGGTVQLIDEVLGNALHVRPHFFYLRSGFFGSCHP